MGLFFLTAVRTGVFREVFRRSECCETPAQKDSQMARKPNYGYEKRQKEIAKKAKKEEKRKRKQEDVAEETPEQE